MFQIKVVQQIGTHILCSATFFPKIVPFFRQCRKICWCQRSCRWQYGGAFHAGLIRLHAHRHKPTPLQPHTRTHSRAHTQRTCNTYCFSTATMVSRTRLSVTLYVHHLSCSKITETVLNWVNWSILNDCCALNTGVMRNRPKPVVLQWECNAKCPHADTRGSHWTRSWQVVCRSVCSQLTGREPLCHPDWHFLLWTRSTADLKPSFIVCTLVTRLSVKKKQSCRLLSARELHLQIAREM